MSLTATISTSVSRIRTARKTLRPIRPKPLMPTRTLTNPSIIAVENRAEGTIAPSVRRVTIAPVRLSPLAAAALAALAGGCAAPAVDGDPPSGAALLDARVERVVDGDTLVARAGGERFRVRLLGHRLAGERPAGRPGGVLRPRGGAAGRAAAAAGHAVRLETDPTQDRVDDFGRLLAYVVPRAGGEPVNQRLVREGFAEVFVFRGREFRRLPAFAAAERAARDAGRGLWGRC